MNDLPHPASSRFHYAMLLLAALASIAAAIYSASTVSQLRYSIVAVTRILHVQKNIGEVLAENQDVETQALRYLSAPSAPGLPRQLPARPAHPGRTR